MTLRKDLPAGLFLTAALGLAACGGGGSSGSGATPSPQAGDQSVVDSMCEELAGGGTLLKFSAPASCTDCVVDGEQAIDGSHDTGATVYLSGDGEPVTLIAKAQDGVVYPAGQTAAVILQTGVQDQPFTAKVSTSLNGEKQSTQCLEITPSGDLATSIVNVTSDSPYDSIELVLDGGGCLTGIQTTSSSSGESGGTLITIQEFCAEFSTP